ncbi:MAG: GNAT family N-acetyltransferase [Oscillospiraceae bacterium]|nr:GNAT family N-acetyltransferase [Oscillospiraceae bacterium]
MKIEKIGFDNSANKLFKIIDSGDHMYNKSDFIIIEKLLLTDTEEDKAGFKVFTYKDSLRFEILSFNSPCSQMIEWFIYKIKRCINDNKKSSTLLWYSQINGFSNILIERFDNCFNPYHFYRFRIEKDDINSNVDMKGLIARKCTEDMIDACIDVMEDLFTPFPDTPGSFRNDKQRITSDFLYERGGTTLFFKDSELIGFCGHKDGHITETCVRKEFQGKGYGEVIVRSVLKLIYESGCDAEITTGHYNQRAAALYQKVGFKKVYESIRVNL